MSDEIDEIKELFGLNDIVDEVDETEDSDKIDEVMEIEKPDEVHEDGEADITDKDKESKPASEKERSKANGQKINRKTVNGSEQANKNNVQTNQKKKKTSKVDRILTEKDKATEGAVNFTGDVESERDYLPVRQGQESSTGCLGGIMYFVFVSCLAVLLAILMWMAASDMLALNQSSFEAEVALPTSIFTSAEETETDEDGNVTGTERVTHADIDYVASQLKDAGLIQYKWLFKLFCQVSHADTKLDPGTYELKSTYDYRALIKNMQAGAGNALTVTVTIPEGFTMEKIFRRMEENNVATYDELMEAAANATFNYDFIAEATGDNANRLEGFLFPDTYEFYVNMEASSAINKMLANFYNRMTDDMLSHAADINVSEMDIVKIASLIEKEAANDEERPIISSVIYNRILAGMPIGLESSILYIHQDHEGAPTAEMNAEDSPYNLLINTGLPPTPICNPGLASIKAAVYRNDTGYYYFTLDTATGTHRFFDNYDDFAAFVATQDYG